MSPSATSQSVRHSIARPAHTGLSLIELLVVMAIIAILVGLLMPALLAARKSSHIAACTNNIQQIIAGLSMYVDATRGCFPLPPVPERPSGWAIAVLPFVEETSLAGMFDYKQPLGAPANVTVAQNYRPELFICPITQDFPSTMPSVGMTHYVVRIDDKDRIRRNSSRNWLVRHAKEGKNFPWCVSPELLPKPMDPGYDEPHPGPDAIFGQSR